MPHLTLEYSSNLDTHGGFEGLFTAFHDTLSAVAGIRIENCKSRAVVRDVFAIGRGGGSQAFVHLDVRILEGRSTEVKQALGRRLLHAAKDYFGAPEGGQAMQITVEIRDISREVYFKFPTGTLEYDSTR